MVDTMTSNGITVTTSPADTQGPPPIPWHAKYPEPANKTPASMSPADLLAQFKSGDRAWKDFLLIDLRKADHEGGTIRGSLNLPAQSLYASLPTLFELCKNSGIKQVIFFCGSSKGRGTRAAGWLDDLCKREGIYDVQSLTLEGGIKGWVKGGSEYTEFMDEYEGNVWDKST